MTQHDIHLKFRVAYNGQPNFMTPEVLDYGKRGEHLFEISTGKGLGSGALYGVTVITVGGEKCFELSKCFNSIEDARAYTKTLPQTAT